MSIVGYSDEWGILKYWEELNQSLRVLEPELVST